MAQAWLCRRWWVRPLTALLDLAAGSFDGGRRFFVGRWEMGIMGVDGNYVGGG